MKTILIVLLFIFCINMQGQTVNGIPLKDIDVQYVQIVGISQVFGNKLQIQIDFGQNDKLFSGKDTQLLDKEGKALKFNSMIDALNFMNDNGYSFTFAYAVTVGNYNAYYYLLKKNK
jgi:hypothetical protein